MLTLRAAIADYAQWGTTPLDFTMNPFHLFDSGNEVIDPNFTLAVLQQARNSTRMVQAGNHALNYPTYSFLTFLYSQMTADAALDPAATPASFQTDSPDMLAASASSGSYPNFTGPVADWPNAVANGMLSNGGNIELWNFSGPNNASGFQSLSPEPGEHPGPDRRRRRRPDDRRARRRLGARLPRAGVCDGQPRARSPSRAPMRCCWRAPCSRAPTTSR